MPARSTIRRRAAIITPVAALSLAVLVVAGCGDAASQQVAALQSEAARSALVTIDDVPARLAPALADTETAAHLAGRITALRRALVARDEAGARRALSSARASLETYARRAPASDAADRDAIAFALDATEQLLAR